MSYLQILLLIALSISSLNAQSISITAKELNLYAGTKASIQWKRIFSSQRRMVKFHIDELSQMQKEELKIYLINHAADSEQPIVPGL